jgi:hypothetical protein
VTGHFGGDHVLDYVLASVRAEAHARDTAPDEGPTRFVLTPARQVLLSGQRLT